jgi:hypothetical protein
MTDFDTKATGRLSPDTTPTWEMELLVSGATIFGLLQLPGLIDHAFFKALNLSPQDYAQLLWVLWIYSKAAIVTLVITFIAHLFLRGYWVALVGMNSVYPGGIRWENLGMGPIARAVGERRNGSMPATIERADNRATRVFATGFGFAMIMLMLPMAMLLVLACSLLFEALVGPGHTMAVVGSVVAVVIVPWVVSRMLDQRLGARISPAGSLGRTLAAVLGFYARLGLGRGSNQLVALFASHEGRARAGMAGLMILMPVMAILMVQSSIAKGRLPLGQFIGLSTDDPYSDSASPAAFYGDTTPQRFTLLPLPHIPSRVVQGPYLELFIPFLPRMHAPAMQARCPDALALRTGPQASRARVDCLAKLADLRIDDVPAATRLDASSDPDTGQPGMLAMLPMDGLSSGRHELSLGAPAQATPEGDAGGRVPQARRYRIPFWK